MHSKFYDNNLGNAKSTYAPEIDRSLRVWN